MSEVLNIIFNLNSFLRLSRARLLIPHPTSPLPPFFLLPRLSMLYLAGDIAQLKLPEGMQTVNFKYCEGLTGTAELGYE